ASRGTDADGRPVSINLDTRMAGLAPGHLRLAPMCASYWNQTPNRLALLHFTLHGRTVCSGAIKSSNASGMPTTVSTCRQAPLSERLRTMQSTTEVLRLKMIFPDLSVR